MSGLWITCIALGASAFLSAKVSSVSDNLTPPSRLRRALGIVAIICIIAVPIVRGHSSASANPGVSQSSDPSATENVQTAASERYQWGVVKPAGLVVEELQEADTESMAGATCWATDSKNKTVFASDGTAVVRIGGVRVQLFEMSGRTGGNALYSLDHTISVIFEDRPGQTIYFEEGVSKPMAMTVLNGDDKRSIPVMRSCGA
ncbi:hypothetical protein ACMT1E_13070 [Sphingomonas flavalba]|uniref:hypothetical protein n=1 Tax=Sphingomonas flavalba TaxID=2559804 RepID=UPI0039E06580